MLMEEKTASERGPKKARKLGITLIVVGLMAFYPILFIGGSGWGSSTGEENAALSYSGGVIIELQGNSWPVSLEARPVQGTDNQGRQEYKFKSIREGEDFHYVIAGLPRENYDLELNFVEYAHALPGGRVFNVYCNGTIPPGLASLDLCAKAGKERAYQVNIAGVSTPGGILDLRFEAVKGLALVGHIRLSAPGEQDLEVKSGESRHWTYIPLRLSGSSEQNVYEAVLGRFGSRFMINPVPQLLAWRQSPLGTWTDDLSEFVLAFRDEEGDIRCLPFTDRYPSFSAIDQQLSLTGITYLCQDPSLPFQAVVTLTAPFYPEDVKLSTAPFFYLDVDLSNPSGEEVTGEILLARPHKDDNIGDESPRSLKDSRGYKYTTEYTYGQESHVNEENNSGCFEFWEALAVDEPSRVNWHYEDITSTSWLWDSPPDYPLLRSFPVYAFVPRGYSGFDAPFTLEAQGRDGFSAVLACHSEEGVLEVRGEKSNRFIYNQPSGPNLGSVDAVVEYALGSDRPAIEERTTFFNGIISEYYLSPLPQAGRDLAACALQNFICNAWWVYDNWGKEWFSVWEGEPYMYHSSVDVEYTNAFFYLSFWPDLLKTLLQEWVTFEKELEQGKCVSHDMGVEHWANGMAYPHDMPVEENADYILLLYTMWKNSGDTAFMQGELAHVVDYTRFIFNCDTDGDGLPDINVDNTIDQGSHAVQHARNQTYLGVKALGAYRAASEMASAQDSPDTDFIAACEERVGLINRTLEEKLWLGDHFAVCSDPAVSQSEREAYSIYAANGLLYLLASGLDPALTASNIEKFKQDLTSATSQTMRRFGSVHTSVDNENEWVSQNLWRDALGFWLGVPGWPAGQADRLTRYWDLEHYFASKKNGGFWDVCAYNPGKEERHGAMRGPFLPEYAYDQSLGYYSRGAAFLPLSAALGRLRLDRGEDSLLYDPAYPDARVPVFSCADWGAGEADARVPLLIFDSAGNLQEILNSHLLPENMQRSSL